MRLVFLLIGMAIALHAETETLIVHMILHAIGEERYQISSSSDAIRVDSTFRYSDRGMERTTTAVLRMKADYTPLSLEVGGQGASYSAKIENASASVQERTASRGFALPELYFTIPGPAPFAVQMALMRYWAAHGKPNKISMLRAQAGAEPIEIALAGRDSIAVGGRTVALDRYTIANLMFGREILWMTKDGDLAAAMTFAGGLPMEVVRAEYESALPQLDQMGVAQEMADLKAISRSTPPERENDFAIVGATLVDATGAPPIPDSVVLVRNGRIAAAGARAAVRIPPGTAIVRAEGQTLLPGLWEMHTHFSGVEFGPALLAAGITTARDCGGEFDYLVAQRDAVEKRHAPGPRLLLAGLVDAGGAKAFGAVTAETPEEGRAVVNRYHAAGFEQIKLYTYLSPDVVKAIAAEAHRLGMSVTGHVPRALTTFEGIKAGMDQINHLNYVSNMLHDQGADDIDFNSDIARQAIRFLKDHGTVVDPTAGWGEMAGHSKEVDVASFEPGILNAPFILDAKFRGMGGDTTAEQMRSRSARSLAVIAALHAAGVPLVPGSDTGLVGYGLLRELELYVEAGLTPLEAIQSATIVSARAMHLDHDSGTIEPEKRADLILVDGNPLANIKDLRKVSRVVANGRLYDAAKLWRSVGFHPERSPARN